MLNLVRKSETTISERISLALAKKFANKMNLENVEYLKIKLGIEIVLINLTKCAIVYLFAIIFNTLSLTLILHGAYFLLRRYSFGLHAKSSIICTLISLFIFVFLPYLFQDIKIDNYLVLPLFILFLGCFYLYAPSDTENYPLYGAERRKKLRNKTVQTCLLILVGVMLVPNQTVKLMITLGVLVQVISILPVTYKLLKRRRNNYENSIS